MIAFTPLGPIVSFTGATTAPTSVQAVSLNNMNVQTYCIENISATIDCVVGWGADDTTAKANAAAAATVSNCFYMPFGKQRFIIGPPNAYFSGITASSTAVIKVQAGYSS